MNETNKKWINAFPEGDALRLGFPERVTSVNAPEVREEVFALLSLHPHTALVADFAETAYISSAGLRIIMELVRREKQFTVINVSSEVYEIFDVTGFLHMVDIRRKAREISLENAVEIAWGASSRVYRLDGDTIVKVYESFISRETIENELLLAKQAFIAGIPTAISYDIVNVGDKLGVVFECINGATLRDALRDEPENFDDYMDRYVELIRLFDSTPVTDPAIPDYKALALERLEQIAHLLTPRETESMKAILTALPGADTYLHGDLQVKNVILSGGEMILIDMANLSKGSPLFELANLFSTYVAFEDVVPGNNESFLDLSREFCRRMIDRLFEKLLPVFGSEPYESTAELVRLLGYFQCTAKLVKYKRPEDAEKAADLLRKQLARLQ